MREIVSVCVACVCARARVAGWDVGRKDKVRWADRPMRAHTHTAVPPSPAPFPLGRSRPAYACTYTLQSPPPPFISP